LKGASLNQTSVAKSII